MQNNIYLVDVSNQKRIKKYLDTRRVIIGPGCSIAPEVPRHNLKAVRENL